MSNIQKSIRCRKWQLTINNPKEHNLEHKQIKELLKLLPTLIYWCLADEIGQDGNTYHTHIFLYFKNPIRFSTLKNCFSSAHIEKAKGTSQENKDYILKQGKWENTEKAETKIDGTFEEFGEVPDDSTGFQSNQQYYGTLYQLIADGLTDGEILASNPNYIPLIGKFQQIRNAIKENTFSYESRENLEVHYIYGPARWNKEKSIRKEYEDKNIYVISDYDHPFDDYDCQDVIIFKDFHSDIAFNTFVHYLEKYPLRVGSRFNKKSACYTKVYIMSDINLHEQYEFEQMNKDYYQHTFLDKITSTIYCKNKTEEINHPINFYYVEDDDSLPFGEDDTPTP